MKTCCQVNLQSGFGGGEVYTAHFASELVKLGFASFLFVHPAATAWRRLRLDGVNLRALDDSARLPPADVERSWWVFHTPASHETVAALKQRGNLVTAFSHMPMHERDAAWFRPLDRVFGVSRYVIRGLIAAGLAQTYGEPLYGRVDLERGTEAGGIMSASEFDWDRRKLRDRVLAALEPQWRRAPVRRFSRRPGTTLGIVSRLTPIKQFPLLFSIIAKVLARHAEVNLEIFGSGGYASVRDLRRALAPLGERARFWGQQRDVRAVYSGLDALLAGLPEKEALGLNVIEAQACGVPVLAPDGPPFDETVLDGVTGLRYVDPRRDGGVDFERVLVRLVSGEWRFDAENATAHLRQFSDAAYRERLARLVGALFGRT